MWSYETPKDPGLYWWQKSPYSGAPILVHLYRSKKGQYMLWIDLISRTLHSELDDKSHFDVAACGRWSQPISLSPIDVEWPKRALST